LSRISAEAGKTVGRVYRSFTQGLLSENRPVAEAIADGIDNMIHEYKESKNKQQGK
jgi:hypothetical protein